MSERANVFAINSWENADYCCRMEELLRASDPDLAHYSLPPQRPLMGTTEEVAESILHRIRFATAVVVLNTPGLHRRPFSDFEMRSAVTLRKRIVVVQPHREFQLPVPAALDGQVYRYATWRSDVVGRAIRGEYPQDGRVFDLAEIADRRQIVGTLAAGVTAISLVVVASVSGALRKLHDELKRAGVHVHWKGDDTARLLTHVAGGAVILGCITALLTGDTKTGLIAATAGAAIGAAIAVQRTYTARLLGTTGIRVVAIEPA